MSLRSELGCAIAISRRVRSLMLSPRSSATPASVITAIDDVLERRLERSLDAAQYRLAHVAEDWWRERGLRRPG
jgi:hypothetical protein